jgi:hypothetical protein
VQSAIDEPQASERRLTRAFGFDGTTYWVVSFLDGLQRNEQITVGDMKFEIRDARPLAYVGMSREIFRKAKDLLVVSTQLKKLSIFDVDVYEVWARQLGPVLEDKSKREKATKRLHEELSKYSANNNRLIGWGNVNNVLVVSDEVVASMPWPYLESQWVIEDEDFAEKGFAQMRISFCGNWGGRWPSVFPPGIVIKQSNSLAADCEAAFKYQSYLSKRSNIYDLDRAGK